jgi:hypothetical protein
MTFRQAFGTWSTKAGMAKRAQAEHWKVEPDEHDYPAALAYLTLVLPPATAEDIVARLRVAEVLRFKAKDLIRASRLRLLPVNNFHVAADLRKVKRGQPLSPVLLVRGHLMRDVALTVADGYHRVCASYALDENADIPCRLVDYPAD